MGNAAYSGEQLLMWLPGNQIGELMGPIGMYHGGFNFLPTGLPILSAPDAATLESRRPAELLLLSTTGAQFEAALVALGPYQPVLARTTVMRQGTTVLHAWLIVLRYFARHAV